MNQKNMSCKCKCKFDCRTCNSNQKWYNDQCWCQRKNKKKHSVCKKRLYWSPGICCCKNSKYLASIISDSVITCDEIVEETKTVPTSFNEKMEPVKQINCYFASLFY